LHAEGELKNMRLVGRSRSEKSGEKDSGKENLKKKLTMKPVGFGIDGREAAKGGLPEIQKRISAETVTGPK